MKATKNQKGQSAAALAVRWSLAGAVHLDMWQIIPGAIARIKRLRPLGCGPDLISDQVDQTKSVTFIMIS